MSFPNPDNYAPSFDTCAQAYNCGPGNTAPAPATIQALLDGKANVVHKTTHAIGGSDVLTPADIGAQPAGSYELLSNKNVVNGYAGLGSDGKVLLNLLPETNALDAIAFAIALG